MASADILFLGLISSIFLIKSLSYEEYDEGMLLFFEVALIFLFNSSILSA